MLELRQADPPTELKRACKDPVEVPSGALAAGPVERLWASDRVALDACGQRHTALVQFYQQRDNGLAGEAAH